MTMRLTLLSTIMAVALACGREKKAETTQAAGTPLPDTAAAPAAPAPSAPAGPIVEVKLTGNGSSKAAFEPNTLTIAPGTTVRFVNVSGGAHNIAFWADSIPQGAADALIKGMPNQMTELTGPFVIRPNDTYDVSFAGAPVGVYKGYCQPHMALGMKMKITVK
jgi:plastocyanin